MNTKTRPNILFAFADDWGRYASCYAPHQGENSFSSLIDTPNIDRIASEGVMFTQAHVPAPSCTPCRSSVLTGRPFWQTRLGAILMGAVFDHSIPTYPVLLKDSGYHVGFTYKVWAPGVALNDPYAGEGRTYNQAGTNFDSYSFYVTDQIKNGAEIEDAKKDLDEEVRGNFRDFLSNRDDDQPFCYWWGPVNTHRKWQKGSGKELWGIDPDYLKGKMPDFFPDVHEVREDVADYLGECQALDRGFGVLLQELEAMGELNNTFIAVSGDHGIPGFPRAKCNLYDIGTEVPLLARLPKLIPAGKVVERLTNIYELAPTFLDIAGVSKPEGMIAESLLPLLSSDGLESSLDDESNYVITGRERHVASARQWNLPYPMRSIRTPEYTYIKNYKPDRWPAGDPKGMDDPSATPPSLEELEQIVFVAYPDIDPSPCKAWMVHHRSEAEYRDQFAIGFDKRPGEELYNLDDDPWQMNNLAYDPQYQEIKNQLSDKLKGVLISQEDPREMPGECKYEYSPYTDLAFNGDEYKETIKMSKARWEQS